MIDHPNHYRLNLNLLEGYIMKYIKIKLIGHQVEYCHALGHVKLIEVVEAIKDGSNARLIARPLNIKAMRGGVLCA